MLSGTAFSAGFLPWVAGSPGFARIGGSTGDRISPNSRISCTCLPSIVSYCRSASAILSSAARFSERMLLARLYCSSMILWISASIRRAVSSQKF